MPDETICALTINAGGDGEPSCEQQLRDVMHGDQHVGKQVGHVQPPPVKIKFL